MRAFVFVALVALAACDDKLEVAPAEVASGGTTQASARGAETDRLPRIRPGLWEIVRTTPQNPLMSVRSCVNAEVQDEILNGGSACQAVYRPGSRSFSTTCNLGNGVSTTEGSFSGDFQKNYTWEAVTTEPGMAPYTETGEAIFRGACPEGWMPGDQEMGGRRIYLSEWRAAARAMAEGR